MVAAGEGYADVCQFIIEAGINVDHACPYGWTALHLARRHGWTDMAAALIQAGVDTTLVDLAGRTARDVRRFRVPHSNSR